MLAYIGVNGSTLPAGAAAVAATANPDSYPSVIAGQTLTVSDPSKGLLANDVNVLALGEGRLVAIEENKKTNHRLRDAGFEVHTFPGSEICINGSGGPTCLTRPLLREG